MTECFGNALLTRHPIVDVHRIDLSMERREAARGAGGDDRRRRHAVARARDTSRPAHSRTPISSAADPGLSRFGSRHVSRRARRFQRLAAGTVGRARARSPPRAAAASRDVSGILADRRPGSHLGSPDECASAGLCPRDSDRPARVGSLSRRGGDRRRLKSFSRARTSNALRRTT